MQVFRSVFSRFKTWPLLSVRAVVLLLIFLVVGMAIGPFAVAATPSIPYVSTSDLMSPSLWPEIIIGWIAMAFNALAWMLGRLIIIVLGMIIIPILGYNEFGTSGIVTTGWTMVRDVVNMFVIVILLLMALQTIVGVGRIDWRQQLPKFLLGVVAVNFSKTITLLMIDIGQVVLFTFVNAISDVAAGNFINLFQLSKFYEVVSTDSVPNSLMFLATAVATCYLLAVVLGTLLLLALAFIYRIVVLWVLIIISPIAFFLGGVGDTLKGVSGTYQDWWKRLTGAVTFGPIMAFFLWLALASASAGSIASSEKFNTETSPEVEQSAGLMGEIFGAEEFLSVLLAVVLIMVGFQAAQSQAEAAGGGIQRLINKDKGRALARAAATVPTAAAYAGARLGFRGARVGAQGGVQLAKKGAYYGVRGTEYLTQDASGRGAITRAVQSAAQTATELRKGSPSGTGVVGKIDTGLSRLVGSGVLAATGRMEGVLAKQDKAEWDAGTAMNDAMSDTQQMVEYEADVGQRLETPKQEKARLQQRARLATDKDKQKQFKSYLTDRYGEAKGATIYDQQLKQALESTDTNAGKIAAWSGDDKFKDKLYKSKVANMDKLYTDLSPDERQVKLKELIASEDFKASMLTKDGVQNKDVQEALQSTVVGTFRDSTTNQVVPQTGWDLVRQGKGIAPAVRDIAGEVENTRMSDFGRAKAEEIKKTVKSGAADLSKITSSNINRSEKLSDGTEVRPVIQGLADAAAEGVDLSKMGDAMAEAFRDAVVSDPAVLTPAEQRKRAVAVFSAKGDPEAIGVDLAAKTIDKDSKLVARQALQAQPWKAATLEAGVEPVVAFEKAKTNDVTRVIADAFDESVIQKLSTAFETASTEMATEIKNSMATAKAAIQHEAKAAKAAGDADEENRLKKNLRKLERLESMTG